MTTYNPPRREQNPHLPFGDHRDAPFYGKDILSVKQFSRRDLEYIFGVAHEMQEMVARVGTFDLLKGKILANLFYEPSTRTSSSFTSAMERLGGSVIPINEVRYSSVSKGDSLPDTIRTLECYADVIVLRHPEVGASALAAEYARKPVINAGDGVGEHPTQALLDALTIRDHKERLTGLQVAILGDILHSRVARSNIHLLSKFGARIALAGPPPLVPKEFERLAPGVTVCSGLDAALTDADVVMMLRVQLERQREPLFASPGEYARHYCLTPARLERAKPDAIVMHPGPFLRGIDISGEVADSPRSVIPHQVENGVAVRMAVLELLTGEPA